MITTKDIAWAAGFLEGEGSFTVGYKKSSPSYHGMRVSAPQVQLAPLERLQRIFGGSIYPLKLERKINTWQCTGERAVGVMMTIYTLMSPKRKEQIKHCLDKWKASNALYGPAKKFCKRGHPWVEENIRSYRQKRTCKLCDTASRKLSRSRRREKLKMAAA